MKAEKNYCNIGGRADRFIFINGTVTTLKLAYRKAKLRLVGS